MTALTPRWSPLRPHPQQYAYFHSPHRFNVVPAGRRSGKTEIAKRRLVRAGLRGTRFDDPRFFAAAPTRDQAKRIYWNDLKALVRPDRMLGKPKETDLMIALVNGAEIWVVGMDRPERIEGQPWDGGILDEYANMKPHAWHENVRPALSDRAGWCDFIGVPEGRNHYYGLYDSATAMMLELGPKSDWGAFHWPSADILPPEEIEAARRDLDELTFQQEYEASFINFEGQAYYPFRRDTHAHTRLHYDRHKPLIVCLDFNVDPGVAAFAQEQTLTNGLQGTGVVGQVHIPRNSNTRAVCRKILTDWGKHEGPVCVYGDATGGARGSAKIYGSDWDLVREYLKRTGIEDLRPFGERCVIRLPNENPPERKRLNAVNSRLLTADGSIRLMVDPVAAPDVVKDFEGVRLLEGGSGEIDKDADLRLTHLTDALGYYVAYEFPVQTMAVGTEELEGLY